MSMSSLSGIFSDDGSMMMAQNDETTTTTTTTTTAAALSPPPGVVCAGYRETKINGPPTRPLAFPKPVICNAHFVTTRVVKINNNNNNITGPQRHSSSSSIVTVKALCRLSTTTNRISDRCGENNNDDDTTTQHPAYVIQKKISRTKYGSIYLCNVLRRSHSAATAGPHWTMADDDVVAIKCSSWSKLRSNNNNRKGTQQQHGADPMKEAACIQLIGNYHPNIIGCIEVLQDDEYLYTVMPYCSGGPLVSRLQKSPQRRRSTSRRRRKHSSSPARGSGGDNNKNNASVTTDRSCCCASTVTTTSLSSTTATEQSNCSGSCSNETNARKWFCQLLSALSYLQTKGICHCGIDINNNLMLDSNDNLILVDFGTALRVPYRDRNNLMGDSISDVSEGGDRLFMTLLTTQKTNPPSAFTAPEIMEGDVAIDGFAADLWSAGVVLFACLVGLAPFKVPSTTTDHRYAKINQGKLKELIQTNLLQTKEEATTIISDSACDLIQNLLWRDPQKRLTLLQILHHPWLQQQQQIQNDDDGTNRNNNYDVGMTMMVRETSISQMEDEYPEKGANHITI